MNSRSKTHYCIILLILSSCYEKPEELVELEKRAARLAKHEAVLDSLKAELRALDSLNALPTVTSASRESKSGFTVPDFRTQLGLHRAICNDEEKYKGHEFSWEVEVIGSSGRIMKTRDGGIGVAIHFDPILEAPDGMFILYGPGGTEWSDNVGFPSLELGADLLVHGRVYGNMHGEASGCVPVLEVLRARRK